MIFKLNESLPSFSNNKLKKRTYYYLNFNIILYGVSDHDP